MRIGVVGATGLVGGEMLRILEERAFPLAELRGYASARSEGRKLPFAGGEVACQVLRPGCFDGLDLVVVDVDDPLAIEWVAARPSGPAPGWSTTRPPSGWTPTCRWSWPRSTRRTCPTCPRASPPARTARRWCWSRPWRRCTGPPACKRMVVSSYQSVSGAGQPGMRELEEQWTKGAGEWEALPPGRRRRAAARPARCGASRSPATSSRWPGR